MFIYTFSSGAFLVDPNNHGNYVNDSVKKSETVIFLPREKNSYSDSGRERERERERCNTSVLSVHTLGDPNDSVRKRITLRDELRRDQVARDIPTTKH